MKTIKGDLILKENTTIVDDLTVEGNIICEGGLWNLTCKDLICWNLNCKALICWNLICWGLDCKDLNFYAVAVAYKSFKCKSWKARRDNYIIKCLDGEIEIKDKKVCDKCGAELKELVE